MPHKYFIPVLSASLARHVNPLISIVAAKRGKYESVRPPFVYCAFVYEDLERPSLYADKKFRQCFPRFEFLTNADVEEVRRTENKNVRPYDAYDVEDLFVNRHSILTRKFHPSKKDKWRQPLRISWDQTDLAIAAMKYFFRRATEFDSFVKRTFDEQLTSEVAVSRFLRFSAVLAGFLINYESYRSLVEVFLSEQPDRAEIIDALERPAVPTTVEELLDQVEKKVVWSRLKL